MFDRLERWVDRSRKKRGLRALARNPLKTRDRRAIADLFGRTHPGVEFVVCRVGDSLFAVSPRDKVIGGQFLDGIPFEKDNFDKTLALIERHGYSSRMQGRWFVDIGANIGSMTVYAHRTGIFRGALCFEPEPKNYSLLEINTRLNRIGDCRLFQVALGDRDGSVSFELAGDNFGDHRVRVGEQPADGPYSEASRQTIDVPVTTLDATLVEAGIRPDQIGCVWIDTQGYEGFVLLGAECLKSGSILTVTEFWPYGMKRAGSWAGFRRCALEYFEAFHDLDSPAADRKGIEEIDQVFARLEHGTEHTDLLLVPRTP